MKEIKDLNQWKDIQYLWIERLNVVKMTILSKWSIYSKQSLSKFWVFFEKLKKLILKFLCNYQEPWDDLFYMSKWLGQRMSRYLLKHSFWVCLWEHIRKRFSIWISKLSKEICFYQCGWAYSDILRTQVEQKRVRKGKFLCCLFLSSQCLGLWPHTGNYTISSAGFQVFKLGLYYTTVFPGSQLAAAG